MNKLEFCNWESLSSGLFFLLGGRAAEEGGGGWGGRVWAELGGLETWGVAWASFDSSIDDAMPVRRFTKKTKVQNCELDGPVRE